jgi:hypothetical protein
MTIRSMTWADIFRPPTRVMPPDAATIEAALIAESIECLLRATLGYDLSTTATRDLTIDQSHPHTAQHPESRRRSALSELQDCANALLAINVRLSAGTHQHAR